MKKATNFLRQKLEGIHAGLIQSHADSKQYAPSITGAEREIVNRSLLSLALAPGYRVGTGTILDQHGDDSGQVDIVIEQPFSLSFPVSSDQNRLFLAPSVCAAFEVKSDLYRQGDDAMKKIAAIKKLHRILVKSGENHSYDDISIPAFIIGFKGPSTEKGIEKIYKSFSDRLIPNGILSIEGEIFYGRSPGSNKLVIAKGKETSVFAFLQCIAETLQYSGSNDFKLDEFRSLIEKSAKART
ncbi:conserved protein of unknown function [Pseudomonas sp. JV551A1]|uniref:DUF6602 domain-containing protein n=1 Tax=Pseudomonas sp. JV551A1 TaxID=2078787 RepID=UPI00100CEAD4|nr:DUF6602 domain-containing protein [Pseudomonas sp. JV551A1]SPO55770.1 conserved protein of unknown function [Pseudomonas sp. JV551A1]